MRSSSGATTGAPPSGRCGPPRRPRPTARRRRKEPGLELLPVVGLHRAESIGGLSEVATSIIVNKSPYRGKSFSCYYPSDGSFCMRCDKCFKKLLLRYIADDQEVPESLIDHFLSFPYLARIFSRPYLDWHHVWFYVFQKLRCQHWFVQELQRQARMGPDLSVLGEVVPRRQTRRCVCRRRGREYCQVRGAR